MNGKSSWSDRLMGAAFALLIAAVALHAAVRVIEAVWLALLAVVLVALAAVAGTAWLRQRRRGW